MQPRAALNESDVWVHKQPGGGMLMVLFIQENFLKSHGSHALWHIVTVSIGRVLHSVILQRAQVTEALSAPDALELALPGVRALVFGQVLALFKTLAAVVTFEGLLSRVHTPVAVQVR